MPNHDRALIDELRCTGTEVISACVLHCNSKARRDTRWEKWLSLRPPYEVKRCENCGIRWLSPRPDAEGLKVIYSSRNYFHSGGVTDYLQYADQRTEHFKQRIARLRQMGVRSILDYGAATGDFVAFASEAGLDALGVEFSEEARDEARTRHGIALLSPEEGIAPGRRFDAIHMNHVLEHLADPVKHLQWCFEQLQPGGLLVIEVPRQFENDADRLRRFAGRGGMQQTFDAFSLHHTYFFTPDTLRKACELAGFEVTEICTFVTPNPSIRSRTRRLLERLLSWSARKRHGGDAIQAYAIRPVSPWP